jgi:nitroimidazol reductase NimA-like FMN-containing flavoprotein (pyridoxamine 5'-phosphate oxidase superfamily)
MMSTEPETLTPTLTPLTRPQCLALLGQHQVGRIAWQAVDAQQILPITYTVFEGRVYFRTSAYSILSDLLLPTVVALEVDELDPMTRTGWSVVVHGRTQAVAEPDGVTRRWAIDPLPWAPGGRHLFVEITPTEVTGRMLSREFR